MADAPKKPHSSEEPKPLDALYVSDASGVVDAIEQNRKKILAGIALLALVICGSLIVSQISKQRHSAAARAYTSAAQKGDIAALDAVLVEHPGSIGAGNALLTKADLQIEQGKVEEAQATLERFLADYKSHPLHAHGLFALANIHHRSGDREKAKAYYEDVIKAQADGELTPLSRIRLGDLALEAGDTAAADQRYQEAYTLHPGTPFSDYAEEKIALLKIGKPPLVDRPAPPEAEAPKAEAPKAEAPKAEAPKAEAPKAEAPKAEAPKAEAPKAEAPKAEAPKAEAPKAEAPKAEAPKAEAPKAEAPKAEAPKAEAPKAEAPKAEAPKAEAPKAEAPKAEAPKAEAPKAEAPKAEAPKAEAPKAEAPKAEAPKAEAPKAEAAEEPRNP